MGVSISCLTTMFDDRHRSGHYQAGLCVQCIRLSAFLSLEDSCTHSLPLLVPPFTFITSRPFVMYQENENIY